MLKYCVKKWEKNKDKLEDAIRNDKDINSCSYETLVQLVVKHILNDEDNKWMSRTWDDKNITVIDDGDYQGTKLFLIPTKNYQPGPYDYLMTYADYGSCSVCDTLEGIQSDHYGEKPTDEQVSDYMLLCLHLVQRMIKPYKHIYYDNEDEFGEFEEVEV